MGNIIKLVKGFLASNFSGYLSIILASILSLAFYYIVDKELTEKRLRSELEECRNNNIVSIEKLKQERMNNNFEVERDVLIANHIAELNKRRELEKLVIELRLKNDKVNEDNKKVNKEVSKLKGKCLELEVGANAEVFNEIFN